MQTITDACTKLEEMGVPREDAAMLLPLGMDTTVVTKINLRTLMDMSRQRMCARAYHEFRALFKAISDALKSYSKEWETVVGMLFMPKCEALGYCPEKYSCGRKPQKADSKPRYRYTYVWYGPLPETLPEWVLAGDIDPDKVYDYDTAQYLVKTDHILTDEERGSYPVSETPKNVEYVKEASRC